LKPLANLPMFRITSPNYVTEEIVDFVRARLNPIELRAES